MTVLTQPFDSVRSTANAITGYKNILAQLEEIRARLNQNAQQDGFESAFDEDGNVIAAYAESEDAEVFVDLNALADDALRARNKVKRAAQIGAAGAAGIALTGLALRQAHKKGWTTRAFRKINIAVLPKLTTRRYGLLAGEIVRLILNDNNEGVQVISDDYVQEGSLFLIEDGFALVGDDNVNDIAVRFEDVQTIETTRNAEGDITGVVITASDYRTLMQQQVPAQV